MTAKASKLRSADDTRRATQKAMEVQTGRQSSNPDAELIRLCGEYIAALDAYNQSPTEIEAEDDPLWQAVEDLEAKLDGLNARTLEGMAAKARVVMRLSRKTDGTHDFSSSYTGDWSEQVIRDLLHITGNAAA